MYLSDLNLQFLISNIQAVCNKTILIASPSWQALSCTHTDVTSYTQDVLTYCIASNGVQGVQTRLKRKDRFESK